MLITRHVYKLSDLGARNISIPLFSNLQSASEFIESSTPQSVRRIQTESALCPAPLISPPPSVSHLVIPLLIPFPVYVFPLGRHLSYSHQTLQRTSLSICLSVDTFHAVDLDRPIELFVTSVPHGPPPAEPLEIHAYKAPASLPVSRSTGTVQD